MGRAKLKIKKIENITNRKTTFSKRRNGILKKAYELSVLCDVDVALIMFSPSGRLSQYSGKKSVEEIVERYINFPDHERDGGRSRMESQLEDFRQEILKYQSKLKDMEEHLMVFLGDTSKITSFPEAEYWEKILEEALRRLYVRKAQYSPLETTNVTSFIPEMTNVGGLNWIPPRQVEIINSLESCGPLVQRDHHQHNLLENLTPLLPLPLLFQQQNMNVENPMIRSTFGLEDNGGVHNLELAQGFDVNSSPWNQLYTRGNVQYPVAQGQEPGLLEQFLYGITPSTI